MLDAQTLSDRIEIDDLITSYTVAVDTGDWDRLDEVFTPDATIDYTATGGIAGEFPEVKKWLAETLPAFFSGTQHYVTQKDVRIDAVDPDRADVRVYFYNPMVFHEAEGKKPLIDLGGYYHHELVRTPDGWRSRRLVEELVWERKTA
jgi:hypothetical protein